MFLVCVLVCVLVRFWCVFGVCVCVWCVFDVCLVCFWCVVGVFLVCFWCVFGLFLVCVWCVFGVFFGFSVFRFFGVGNQGDVSPRGNQRAGPRTGEPGGASASKYAQSKEDN